MMRLFKQKIKNFTLKRDQNNLIRRFQKGKLNKNRRKGRNCKWGKRHGQKGNIIE